MNPPPPDHSLHPLLPGSLSLILSSIIPVMLDFETVIHYLHIFHCIDGGSEPSPGRPPTYVQSEYK